MKECNEIAEIQLSCFDQNQCLWLNVHASSRIITTLILSIPIFTIYMLLFCRYLTVETGESHSEKDERIKDMYYTVFKRFSKALVKVSKIINIIHRKLKKLN